MKKIILCATMMLFSLMCVFAQSSSVISPESLEGKWKIGEGFRAILQSAMNEKGEGRDLQVDYILDFGKNNSVSIIIPMQGSEEGQDFTMEFSIPGTYTLKGNTINLELNKENISIKITDIKSDDPELKKLMENPKSRDALLLMMSSMIEEEMKSEMKDISSLVDGFASMSVQSVTDTQLKLKFGEKDIKVAVTFERLDK